jgi:tRNA (cmo5U34)-methyltransferase
MTTRPHQFHDVPATYLAQMRAAIPVYDEFQAAIADAAAGLEVQRVLDLGAGTGETTLAILARYPGAMVTLLDKNPDMLAVAAERVPADRVAAVLTRDFAGPLPAGPFDLVVSSLAVHHLDDTGKRSFFRRVRAALRPEGRFVMGDIVVPPRLEDAVTPHAPELDLPETVRDLLDWLIAARLSPRVTWTWNDLAVISATR